jgi:monofunctional biosynthetic peptidoglycan transglycosylase
MARIRRRSRQGGWPARIFGWFVRGAVAFVLVSLLWVILYRFVPPPFTFTMTGDVLGGRSVSKDWMSLEAMDRDMVRAAIAAEDSKFCTHRGFDQDAIAAAMRRNARGGSVIRGGSTISQQTAKNAFLWQGGGYFRKGLEAWFTLLIENLWGKRRIMEVYLNVAETGIGTYGANAGAQRYFGHDASALSRTEAARIAAILPLPKKRGAIAPKGFTRRYGNSISARVGIVARDGLDACVYSSGSAADPADRVELKQKAKKAAPPRQSAPEPDAPLPPPLPGEEYESAQPEPPTEPEAPPEAPSTEEPAPADPPSQ